MGAFASPNTASIMNAVRPSTRRVVGHARNVPERRSSLSLTLIFTLVVAGLSASLPGPVRTTDRRGHPVERRNQISGIPPVARSSRRPGLQPMASLIRRRCSPAPAAARATVLSILLPQCWPVPHDGLQIAFSVCVLSLGAAAASWLRGRRYIHDYEVGQAAVTVALEPVVGSVALARAEHRAAMTRWRESRRT